MNFSKYYEVIKSDIAENKKPAAETISSVINDPELVTERQRVMSLLGRYNQELYAVPILTRKYIIDGEEQADKINNKINVDHFSDIIDFKIGYLFGIPVIYSLPDDYPEKTKKIFNDFLKYTSVDDLDAEVGRTAAICGYGVKEIYIDSKGNTNIQEINPANIIFISKENCIDHPDYVIKHYEIIVNDSIRTKVVLYDSLYKYIYLSDATGETFSFQERITHFADMVPVIGYPNNKSLKGDAEKVLKLIDAYDRTLSDINSEIEQFRLAYMIFKNIVVDKDLIKQLRQTGGLEVDEDGDIKFLTKDIADTVIENHLNRLENEIYRKSQTPNLADQAFSGNQSGVAIRYKLLPFESKCKSTERKSKNSNKRLFEVLGTIWAKKNIKINFLDIVQKFTRNFPANVKEESETLEHLWGRVPRKRVWSLMSFIDDPAEVEKEFEAELEGDEVEEREKIETLIKKAAGIDEQDGE